MTDTPRPSASRRPVGAGQRRTAAAPPRHAPRTARPVRVHRPTGSAAADLRTFVETSPLPPSDFLRAYRALRDKLRPQHYDHPERVLAAAATVLAPLPDNSRWDHVRSLLGGSDRLLRIALPELRRRLGRPPTRRLPRTEKGGSTLADWLIATLGALPETCLDPDLAALMGAPAERHCARIAALITPAVRLLGGLMLYLGAAKRRSYIVMAFGVQACERLDVLLARGDPFDARWLTQTIQSFLTADDTTETVRTQMWQRWCTAHRLIAHYGDRYPAVAAAYAPFRMPWPEYVCKPIVREIEQRLVAARAARRTQSCAAVADDLPATIAALENRYAEIARIRAAYDAQIAAIKTGAARLRRGRLLFSVTMPRTSPLGASIPGTRTLDFAIVSQTNLLGRTRLIEDHGDRRMQPPLLSDPTTALFLEYLGGRDPVDGLPILEDYRVGRFHQFGYCNARQQAEATVRAERERWHRSARAQRLFRFNDWGATWLTNRCIGRNIILIPIHELHHAAAVGRAVTRCCLAGARIGEVLQQVHGPTAFACLTRGDTLLYRYDVRPKMRRHRESFYISSGDFDAVIAVLKVMKANGWPLQTVAPARAIVEKCDPDRYLYQRDGAPLELVDLNMAIAALLSGWPIRSQDLRHGLARHLRHQGVDMEVIAAVLHHQPFAADLRWRFQTDGGVTGYYCPPTEAMKQQLVARLAAFDPNPDDPWSG